MDSTRRQPLEKAVEGIGGYIVDTEPKFLGVLLYIEVKTTRPEKEEILLCLKQKGKKTPRIELAVFAVLLRDKTNKRANWLNHPSSTTKISEYAFSLGEHALPTFSIVSSSGRQTEINVNHLNHWSYSDAQGDGNRIEMKGRNPDQIKKTLDDLLLKLYMKISDDSD